MPTVFRDGPRRYFSYSNELDEPPHVHGARDRGLAKLWLRPVALAASVHFSAHELRRIERTVRGREKELLEAWNEHSSA